MAWYFGHGSLNVGVDQTKIWSSQMSNMKYHIETSALSHAEHN